MKGGGTVEKLNFSEEFLLDSAERRFASGDYLGALTMINKRNGMFDPGADAFALQADIYEAMEKYDLAADAWFRFLDVCNEADFREGYEGLSVAFMNMGNEAQSAYYYRRAIMSEEAFEHVGEELLDAILDGLEQSGEPRLRLVYSADGMNATESLAEGLKLLKSGELDEARERFSEVSEASSDYPSAAGLSAMCTLMLGDEERAEEECKRILELYPDNVQGLTTYVAVLGARNDKKGAQKAAKRLAELSTDSTEDLYRVATALCETGLDELAYEKLSLLKPRLPYDDNVLYFHAVAAYKTDHIEEAIDSLEQLTTIYPRKAVAEHYLTRMRRIRDGEKDKLSVTYYYRMPAAEYRTVANFLLKANTADEEELAQFAALPELNDFFRIAFDEMEGRDEKIQLIAARVAVKCRNDAFVRELLLDSEGEELVKISVLHDLVMRNEENSFGTVVCKLYKEFFTHEIEIGARKRTEFLKAFADVYSKFALLSQESEDKLCDAATDVYETIEEAEAWGYIDDRAELAAVIYREARLKGGERKLAKICRLFNADESRIKEMLGLLF